MNLNIQRFWKKRSVTITEYDPTYKVVYLGNVLTAWAKGEGCVDKPLATLWKNYCQNVKPDVGMKVTVGNSGLKAVTKEHGLTEYWSNRVTYCAAHTHYPRVFCWVYRHEGKRLRQELRCHAVLCRKEEQARRMASQLQNKLTLALQEFKREKICRQNARLSLANCVYDNPSLPRRKILLSTGSINYRPPLERSKTAPKLMAIEEAGETRQNNHRQRESPFRTRGGRRRQTYPPSSGSSAFEEFGIIKEDEEEDDEEGAGVDDDELDDDVLVGPETRRTNVANSRDEPYRNFLLREYQLQQRRQRLLTSPIRVRLNRYGDEEEEEEVEGELRLDAGDDSNDNDCVVDVTDLDEVRLLLEETGMTSSATDEAEVEAALLLADDYESVAVETFTSNPRAGSAASSETDRRHHHHSHHHHHHRRGSTDNDNDGFDTSSSAHSSPSSSSGPSSTNSSPLSSVREGRREATTTPSEGAGDDDIVSDESGYSEDNLNCTGQQQRHATVTRTFTCDI